MITNKQQKEFQAILNHLPLFNIPMQKVSSMTNVGMTSLYHYRKGLCPNENKYKYILAMLHNNYPTEMRYIKTIIELENQLLGDDYGNISK